MNTVMDAASNQLDEILTHMDEVYGRARRNMGVRPDLPAVRDGLDLINELLDAFAMVILTTRLRVPGFTVTDVQRSRLGQLTSMITELYGEFTLCSAVVDANAASTQFIN